MRQIGPGAESVDPTEAARDTLPAGPLSGLELTLWRSRTGTVLHGDRDCPSLARSTPTAVAHPLGNGTTYGDLDWPGPLHCRPRPGDPQAATYLRHAQHIAREIPKAQGALDAIPLDLQHVESAHARDPYAPITWPWATIAPPLLRALLEGETGVGLPDYDPHIPFAEPMPAQLSAATSELRERLAAAAESLHGLMTRSRHLHDSPLVADAARSVRKAIAAERVLSGYHAKTPSSLWTAYVNAGARAAHGTVESLRTSRSASGSGRLRAVDDHDDRPSDRDRAVVDALDIALYRGGQESYTHHRAHARTSQSNRTWQETFQSWLEGSHFGFGPDILSRREVSRPGIIEIIEPALAAAEQSWDAYLDGVASDRPERCLAAVQLDTRYLSIRWKAAALTLINPSIAVQARDRSVWLLAACAETDIDELLDLGRAESAWIRHDRQPDQAVLAGSTRALAAVAAVRTAEHREQRLTAIAAKFPALRRDDTPGQRW